MSSIWPSCTAITRVDVMKDRTTQRCSPRSGLARSVHSADTLHARSGEGVREGTGGGGGGGGRGGESGESVWEEVVWSGLREARREEGTGQQHAAGKAGI